MDIKIKQHVNTQQYDAIVVYAKPSANSAGDKQYRGKSPFSSTGSSVIYNDSYRYFLLICKKMGIKAAFATSKDIIGSGLFQSFWTYDKKWVKNNGKAHSQVFFDKFTSVNSKQKNKLKLLTSSKSTYMFNNKKIKNVFQNKINTYKQFKEFAIPTVEITNLSKQKIIQAKTKLDKLLKKHRHNVDFSDDYIIKDKTGVGGFNIFKVNFDEFDFEENKKLYESGVENRKTSPYIIQPFINCDNGFVFGKYSGLIDLRIIMLNQKIIQTYIRIAKEGNFKCNEQQGGNLVYMPINTIPKDVLTMARKIIKNLNKKLDLKHAIYSLDFIRSNNGNLYFIEGNDRPGIDWNPRKKINEIKSKELINHIVSELKSIIQEKQLDKSTAKAPLI
ncbi:MAG: ATP-grasp domain-containing protein [Candidatus Diapherotrites archaeon]|nr:ATP-grasp domain-containing protein [Candidatus Diapherotrites archaeon]